MNKLQRYILLAIGYLVGRHYGRQQGDRYARPRIYGSRRNQPATIGQIFKDAVRTVTSRKVDAYLRKAKPTQMRGVVLEADPELEALLDEEERISREREADHSGNYGPNGI